MAFLTADQREGLKAFPRYLLAINYDQTVEQLVENGKYDWANDDVSSGHFPSSEKGQVELLVYLVRFNRNISSEDVIKELDCQGLRPATLKELLVLGIAQPDLRNPIIALGSTWLGPYYGRVCVPRLSGVSAVYLDLDGWSGNWRSGWQFAAVPK